MFPLLILNGENRILGERSNLKWMTRKVATVSAADRDVEGPLRQAFVFEMVRRNDSRRTPNIKFFRFSLGHALKMGVELGRVKWKMGDD